MALPRTTELSRIIAENTEQINRYLAENGHPELSFDRAAPMPLFMDPTLEQKRSEIVEAARELADLMQPPAAILMDHAICAMPSLQAIHRFGFGKALADSDEASYEDVAKHAGLPTSTVRRLLQIAIANRVFKESRPGFISHTAASRLLSNDDLISQWVGMTSEELLPASFQIVEALAQHPESDEPNQAGFNVQNGTEKPFFEYLASTQTRAARFADAMALFDRDPGYSHRHLVDNFPWASLEDATIVDIGGSQGHTALSLARNFPKLKLIIQDREELKDQATQTIPTEFSERILFMAHDFFAEQPVRGAKVYFYRWIFHDWSDKYASRILKALVPALEDGAKIVLQEYVLPEPGQIPNFQERILRTFDLHMLGMHNGRERSASDWHSLFKEVDERFQSITIVTPPGSRLSIIKATWNSSILS